jgi:hypothetical protein
MPKGRQLVTCMFCGLNRPTSIEDVIPKWARYALDPTSSVTARAEPGDSTARMQHLVVTLHGMVREACNNGRMHDLEEKVNPFLKPLRIPLGAAADHLERLAALVHLLQVPRRSDPSWASRCTRSARRST